MNEFLNVIWNVILIFWVGIGIIVIGGLLALLGEKVLTGKIDWR